MALHWNLTAINNHETTCWHEGGMNPETEVLIYATLFVGMPEITARNAVQFFARLSILERVGGNYLMQRPMTFASVQAHIGLKTNATKITEGQFGRVLMRRWNAEEAVQAAVNCCNEVNA